MESLKAFAPYPPARVRASIASEQWQECLKSWLTLTTIALRLPHPKFLQAVSNENLGVMVFLQAYLHENAQPRAKSQSTSKALHKAVYLLCHRTLCLQKGPKEVSNWTVLTDLAWCYHSVASLPRLLGQYYDKSSDVLLPQLQQLQRTLVEQLDSEQSHSWQNSIHRLIPLLRASPHIGQTLALGSDIIDSLANRYRGQSNQERNLLTVFTSLLLTSLIRTSPPRLMLLSEHVYTLRMNAKLAQTQDQPSLLVAIVSRTSFMDQLGRSPSSVLDSDSLDATGSQQPTRHIAAGLQEFIDPNKARRRQGKGMKSQTAAAIAATHAIREDVHFHRMSKIIEIQEMMPGLGSAFVTNLLREYNDNVELAMDHLLNDNLPRRLANADRSEQLQASDGTTVEAMEAEMIFEPRSTHPVALPKRRNVFDNDEFDLLPDKASNWHIGKASQSQSADDMLSSANTNKSAIYASLAAFDADEDERDDTYDTADVGGTIDNTVDADRDTWADSAAERVLFTHWKVSPGDFGRDATMRDSSQRISLRKQTGWTDEQIEGWATMLEREPRRKQQLQRKYADSWQGQQRDLESTAWRAQAADTGDDDEDANTVPRGPARGGRSFRGGFRGGRGRGNTAGTSGDSGTQRARKGKEVRGTHNRREGRAKKVARGMAGPT